MQGYDKSTGMSTLKPRFLEYNKTIKDFYRKRLVIEYAVEGKEFHDFTKLNKWNIPRASQPTIDVYERAKKIFSDNLNTKLLNQIELSEKQEQGKNKSDDLIKVKALYEEFASDFLAIAERMPHMSPLVLEKYINFIKRSYKVREKPTPST